MLLKHKLIVLAIIPFIYFSILIAQNDELKLDSFPATLTQCFHHDIFGFMWIGTLDGLIRYDGNSFKHYKNLPFDSTSISNNWITDIEEDSLGNLWISTYGGGLNYFNQITDKFIRYSGSDKNNTNNLIIKIIMHEDGSLWFTGMTYTLTHFKIASDGQPEYTHYNSCEDLPSESFPSKNSAMTAYKDKSGMIWVGMALDGLLRFNPQTGSMEHFKNDPQNPNSLSHNTVAAICEDDSGNIWIGTGNMRVPKENCGLNMYNPDTKEFRRFQHDWNDETTIASNRIAALLIDQSGILWIATMDNYLDTVPLKELLSSVKPVFRHHTNLSTSELFALYQDRIGNMWIGEKTFVSQKYDRQQNPFGRMARTANYPNSLSLSGAWCVYADHSGRIWAGTEGMDVFDPVTSEYRHYFQNAETNNLTYEFSCIQEDTQGQIWIGANTNGINILDPESGSVKRMTHNPDELTGLVSNNISYLFPRKNGDMWIATNAGLQLFEKKSGLFHNFDPDTTTNEDLNISKLFEDASGTLWIATINNGLYEFKLDNQFNPQVKHYIHEPQNFASISCNAISDFIKPTIVDSNALWIATPAGLNRMDLHSKTFTHFFNKDGFETDWIATILEDNQGDLWCATPYGLSSFRIKTSQILNFGKSDGLPSNYGSGAFRQNGAKGLDGRLYFAGGGGILNFQPTEILGNKRIPPIRITDFKIFQKSVLPDTAIQFKQRITLNYQQNMFSFYFAALNFTSPEKNQYKYKMDGFNDDWIDIGTAHSATFTNLDPGEYVFHIKGSNNHGVWNETGTSVKITILPPWWKTGWAYFTYFLAIGTALFGSVRIEIMRRQRKIENQLQREQELRKLEQANHRAVVAELQAKTAEAQKEIEKEQIRSRIASDLHDEIGSNLSSIALISHVVETKSKLQESMKQRLRESQRIARVTAESMRDIVWFINPINDDMEKLIIKMRDTANVLLDQKDFTFTTPENGITLQGDLNLRRNLFLIYKESLQNIIRHANASKVDIQIEEINDSFILRIRDNGDGFEKHQTISGNGLKNYQIRAKEMGASINVNSAKDKGTEIELSMKIP